MRPHPVLRFLPVLAPLALAVQAHAGTCAFGPADFAFDTLASFRRDRVPEPMHLDFATTSAGVDVYFTERQGVLARWSAERRKIDTLGRVPVAMLSEGGLLGVALDPRFAENRAVYLTYTVLRQPGSLSMRLGRFLVRGDSLVPVPQRVLLEVPFAKDEFTGGALLFDGKGNLWVTVGIGDYSYPSGISASKDTAAPWVAADTRDLRGKILRIRPDDTGYSIPEGNLFPPDHYPQGPDAKTRPEIFAMGLKNPYSLGLDPATGRIAWADMGPDQGAPLPDEYELTDSPGNHGYPYFVGPNTPLEPGGQDPAHPRNTWSGNTGLSDLPPALAPTYAVRQGAPIAGSVCRPDARQRWPMPAALDGRWFLTDFGSGRLDTASFDAAGAPHAGPLLPMGRFRRPLEIRFGPDGSLYVADYAGWYGSDSSTAILRMRFTGTCPVPLRSADRAPYGLSLRGRLLSLPEGSLSVEARTVTGMLLWSRSAAGMRSVVLPAFPWARGIALVTVRGRRWSATLPAADPP